MNLKKNKINVALVCFYLASKGGNGAAEVTLGIYNSIKERKKLFEIDELVNKYRRSNISKKQINNHPNIRKIFPEGLFVNENENDILKKKRA